MLSGGIVGETNGGGTTNPGTITQSFNVGNVVGADATTQNKSFGGIVGRNRYTTVSECFNYAAVSGYFYVGGIIGLSEDSTVNNCYSTGTFPDLKSQYVGGLVGYINIPTSFLNSYSAAAFASSLGSAFSRYEIATNVAAGTAASNLFYDSEINSSSLIYDSGLYGVSGATCTTLSLRGIPLNGKSALW